MSLGGTRACVCVSLSLVYNTVCPCVCVIYTAVTASQYTPPAPRPGKKKRWKGGEMRTGGVFRKVGVCREGEWASEPSWRGGERIRHPARRCLPTIRASPPPPLAHSASRGSRGAQSGGRDRLVTQTDTLPYLEIHPARPSSLSLPSPPTTPCH